MAPLLDISVQKSASLSCTSAKEQPGDGDVPWGEGREMQQTGSYCTRESAGQEGRKI